MEMNSRPTQIYGVPMGVRGYSLRGNVGLFGPTEDQLQTLADLLKAVRTKIGTVPDASARAQFQSRYAGIVNQMIVTGPANLTDDQYVQYTNALQALFQEVAGFKVPAGQPKPGPYSVTTQAPGYIESIIPSFTEAAQSAIQNVTSLFTTQPSEPASAASNAPVIFPDTGPTTYILKPKPPAEIVNLPQTGVPSGAVPMKPQGPSILDTIASVFGGVAVAAPGVTQVGQMFRKPPRQLPQLQQHPQPAPEWPKYAVVGVAVAAVIAISVIAFKPKK